MDIPLVNSDIHGRSSNGPFSLSKESSPNRFPRPFNDSTISNSQYQTLTNSALSPSRYPSSNDENDSFKVYVRIRPLNNKEQGSKNSKRRLTVTKTEDNMVFVFAPQVGVEAAYKQEKSYYFDKVFDSNSSTIEMYQRALTPAIQNVINGFNSTILAYGMTGAGKTFTMFGDIYNSMGGIASHPGIVSLVVRDLFQTFKKESENGYEFNVKLSYLEIYNEHARDLLTPGSEELMIIEDSRRGIMIPNLTEFAITAHDEVVKYIVQGNSRRIMASTNANQFSSRSHAIIQFTVEKRSKTKDIVDSFLQSKLCLVDLAGSERAAVSDNKGLRQREGANINRSLLALGNCINILSDSNKKGAFVPYRDSKLTRLLKDSLGGNTRTVMLACVSPSYLAYEETINTLKYASGARNIKRKIMRNIKEVQLHVSEYKGIIESLRVEVDALKHKLAEKDSQDIDQQTRQRNAPSSEYFNKVDGCLDELGKKLLNLFEENWEITQSVNDLKDLKVQNEATLKAKVTELEDAVGDIALYNQITEEIASLKEVMANNDNIQMEMEASLEKSLQEKKQIQAQILELIAQGVHNPQTLDNLNESQQIDKSLRLLEMEEDILSRSENVGMDTVDNSALTASQGQKKDNKIHKLESEIEKMKRQLLEKDKVIAQNQQIIKTLCQSNSQKPDNMPKLQTFTLKKQPSNPSPIRVRISKNEFLIGPQDPYKFERGTGAFEPASNSATKSSSRIRMKSPTSSSTTIAHALINLKSPERSLATSNIPSTNTSITKGSSVSRKSRGEAPMSRDDSLKKPASSQQKDDKSRKAGHHKQGKSTNKQQQILETVSIEDLKNYAERLKKMSFEAGIDKSSEEKHGYYKHYQNKKKRQEDIQIAAKVQAVTYKIIDKLSPTKALPGNRSHHTQSQTNLASDYGLPVPAETPQQHSMVAPKAQSQQQIASSSSQNVGNGNSSPNLSSIGQSNEQSGDLSMKDILLENFSIDNKEKNYIRKELEKSSSLQDDKENLQQTKETIDNNNEIFDATKDSLTTLHSKTPLYRQLEELQKIECRSLASTDLNTLTQIKQIEGLGSPLSPSSKLRSPSDTNQLKSPGRGLPVGVSSFLANSKQYLQDDSVNKYSKLYEINKARRQAMKEKSPQFHEALRMQKDEVQSPEIFRSPEKFETMTSPTTENTVRGTYRMTENADVSASRELIKHEVRSLEARRGLLKEFRSKLHSYVARVNNNLIHDDQYGEIVNFLNDYRANSQAYPISNADTLAIEKLDLWTIEKAQQMEDLNSARRMTNLNFQSIPQGDNISMINPTDFSRELYSEDRAKQDDVERCFKAPESSRTIAEILDDENNKEKVAPKSGANTQVLDDMESEFDQEFVNNNTQSMQSMQDLVNNCEDIQAPNRENHNNSIKRSEVKPMDQSKGDNEEGEMIESSLVQESSEMKSEVENKLEQENQAQELQQVVSKQGTYFFIFLMGVTVLVLFNALFKSPIDMNGEF